MIQVRSGETPRCHITITSIEEAISGDIPCWIVRFKKGDHTDRPRLLKARPGHEGEIEGDYTDTPARALKGAGEEVSATLQSRFAQNGQASHAETLAAMQQRALEAIGEIKRHAPTGKARRDLTWAEKRIRAAVR